MFLLSRLFRLVDDFAALLAGTDHLAIDFLVGNARCLLASRADDHDFAGMHRSFLHEDAALRSLLVRFRVTLYFVDALDDNLALLRHSRDDFALFAFILTGQHDDRVALLNVQFYE